MKRFGGGSVVKEKGGTKERKCREGGLYIYITSLIGRFAPIF